MADEPTPFAGELVTANYGWTKPNVGNSDDAWGGMINADLDGIDSTVKSVSNAIPAASLTTPAMDGTAAAGTGTTFARGDHVHPVDTSRYAASNPSGYQTAAQVTAAVPVVSSTTPLADGVAAVGTSATYARADHVHPITAMNDNRIINGDMRIDARNNGASGSASGVYTVDRWQFGNLALGTWGRNLNAVAGPVGFPYYLGFQSSSAHASVATDNVRWGHTLEGDVISDFAWGTANAQSVTLSFWAYSSLTGTFSGAISNYAGTRSYPFAYSLPTANTWAKIAVTIPGDAAGAWVSSGNAGALFLSFDLGCGSNFRAAAGAWTAGSFNGATGSVSVVATNAATFYVTGVKLEIGSVATPFNRQSLAQSMIDCQRYFVAGPSLVCGSVYAAGASMATYQHWEPPVSMRATPTVVAAWGGLVNASAGTFSVAGGGGGGLAIQGYITSVAAGAFSGSMVITSASAEL